MIQARALTSAPSASGTREPTVTDILPATGPASSMATVAGSRNSPASVTDAPNPYEVEVGVSTNCGISTNDANMPKPIRVADRLVVQTGRRRSMAMSTSGSAIRCSTTTQATASIAASANSPSVCADPQPQLGPSLTATSSATSQPASSTPPGRSIFPGLRIGDSGTISMVTMVAGTIASSGSQNSQW